MDRHGWPNSAWPVKSGALESHSMLKSPFHSVETKASWVIASVALFAMIMSFGSAL